MPLRINLFGGPGSRKSTLASRIYYELKVRNVSTELITETVKLWAYDNIRPRSFDQAYLFSTQMRKEDVVLRNGTRSVVTDSPVFLAVCYARDQGMLGWKSLAGLSDAFDTVYPSLDILVQRPEDDPLYREEGRFEAKSEAVKMDKLILRCLEERGKPFKTIPSSDFPTIMDEVSKHIALDDGVRI